MKNSECHHLKLAWYLRQTRSVYLSPPWKAFKWHPPHLSHAWWGFKLLQNKGQKALSLFAHLQLLLVSFINKRSEHLHQSSNSNFFYLTVHTSSCSHFPSRPHLYNAENLIIAQMLSLAVDQEVVKLRDAQSQNPQWCVFYSRPVGHNAGCCNGVWDLLLVVRHLLPRSDKQTKIRTIAR